jgi:hypothetical protein
MEEKISRGRPSGESSTITIKDPAMEPFHIAKDKYNFVVIETVKSTRGFAGGEASGKVSEKVVGYYGSFKFALKSIAKEKFHRKEQSYSTLKEYISSWKEVEEGMKQMLNKVEL